jgi:hypothetical protein
MVQKCIAAAESRVKKEIQIRKEIEPLFQRFEEYFEARNYQEAKKILEDCGRMIVASARYKDIRDRIQALSQRINLVANKK